MENYNLETYDYKRNLILVGPPGVGKTYEADRIYERCQETLKYRISDGRFKQLTQAKGLALRNPSTEWNQSIQVFPLEMMIRSKFLFFDDIGVADNTPAYLRNLTFVLDERLKNNLPTIFTTNLTSKEIGEKLDQRIASRLLQNADIVQMTGEDKRQLTAKVYTFKSEVHSKNIGLSKESE